MSSPSAGASTSGRNTDRDESFEEGREYEKLSLVLLAERGYTISKVVNSQFSNFAIGREVGIGDDKKLDDIVFRYEDKDNKTSLIFVQIKHKQKGSVKINSQVLSGSCGHWGRDFNLRQYFNSYLSIREELKTTKFKELKNGKINYVVIFTNADIDKTELETQGVKCEEAPDDIKNLFTFKKSSIAKREFTPCYQLDSDYDYLRSFFEKCSDLHRIAKEFTHVVFQEENKKTDKCKNYIMETDKVPLKQYHVALGKEVIEKSNTTENKSPEEHKMEYQPYCVAKFRNDFLDNKKTGAKKELLDLILEAIRDKSEINTSDNDLKEELRKAQWKVVPNFGQNKNSSTSFPNKWNDVNPPELRKIAVEVANYITSKSYSESNIFGAHETFIKNYEDLLQKDIIKIACLARFRKDFIDNNEQGTKKELLDAILEAIRAKSRRNISDDDLKNVLRKAEWEIVPHFGHYLPTDSFELSRIGKKLAKYVIDEKEREKIILGKKESPMAHYEVAFQREVIEISDEVKCKSSDMQNSKSEYYCDAKFCEEFISNSEHGPKLELRKAIFDAIRKFDKSKQNASDCELENILRGVKLKVDKRFGKIQTFNEALPAEWPTVKDDDIKDFLKCLVLFVKQPDVTELITEIYPLKESFLEGPRLGEVICKLHQKFRDRIEKTLGIYNKGSNEEMWLYGGQIMQFVQELQDTVYTCVLTLKYEDEILQYGSFNTLGNLKAGLDNFFNCKSKVLCICTTMTRLTALKVLQYLVSKDYGKQYGQIFIETGDLNNDRVVNAFRSESNNLLIIHIKQLINQQIVKEFYDRFFDIINDNPNKKIILIIEENLGEKFSCYLKNLWEGYWNVKKFYIQQSEDINFKDFVPVNNPLEKEFILFQEQERKVSVAALTGIDSWDCYVDYISDSKFQNKHDVIDIITEILIGNKVDVGCKPPGTSRLDGAYATLFEEINTETLTNRLLSEELAGDPKEIYIISGIGGRNKEENFNKLIKYLKLVDSQEKIKNQLGEIGSDSRIQITDDQFIDEEFKKICFNYSDKRIFWIDIKDEETGSAFILQQFYDPSFYLQRDFKQVIIKKNVKEQITKENLSENFVFWCTNGRWDLLSHFPFSESEEVQFENHLKNGKIKIFTVESDAKATFEELCEQNEVVHFFKFEENRLIWFNSQGSVDNLHSYVDKDAREKPFTEDVLIKEIKNRKVLIIADDPGMGKSTTLTKLYESKCESTSFIETHWVIKINLKDHVKDIKNIKLVNGAISVISVVNFLSRLDMKLNNNLAKSLLGIALDKSKNFLRPLLLALDGFDEVLDEEDRNKIIDLAKFLKKETNAKIWITTRRECKKILENKLSTFAMEFVPMNDKVKQTYIEKYLKVRLCLILHKEIFSEIFLNKVEIEGNKSVQKYTEYFLINTKSVFNDNIFRFTGTPLQLHLMLQDSANDFKSWIKNKDQNLSFNNLGQDLWEVYKKFIDKKYDVYFQKVGTIERRQKSYDKDNFERCNEELALSLIRNEEPTISFDKSKDMVLTTGIIKSHDNSYEFIHATFRDYFVAKACIKWIEKALKKPSNLDDKESLLKEILKKSDYQLIRTFINLKVKKILEHVSQESFIHFGKMAKKLLSEEQSPPMDEEGTVMHVAFRESNTEIAWFLLKSLKGHKDFLKNFLFEIDGYGKTVLHLACFGNDDKIVRVLLDAAEEISDDTLQRFLCLLDSEGYNALDCTIRASNNVKILKELLKRANNKLDLVLDKENIKNSLCIAIDFGKEEFVKILLFEEFDDNSRKQLLLFKCSIFNVLYKAVRQLHADVYSSIIVQYVLSAAKSIKDNYETLKSVLLPQENEEVEDGPLNRAIEKGKNEVFEIILDYAKSIEDNSETLKKLLLREEEFLPLNLAIENGNIYIVEVILNTAKDIDDDNYTLKKLLYNSCLVTQKLPSVIAAEKEHYAIMELLLELADSLDNEIFKKLIFAVVKNGKNAIRVIVENSHEEIWVDTFKIFKEDKHKSIRKKIVEIYNSIPITDKFAFMKRVLIHAITWKTIADVKNILGNTKSKEELRVLLLAVDEQRCNTLHIAFEYEKVQLIRDLISYAISINDKGKTLKELLTSKNDSNETPFECVPSKLIGEIKQMVESFITEAEIKNDKHVANIFREIDIKCTVIHSPPQELDLEMTLNKILKSCRRIINRTFLKEGITYEKKCIIV